MDSDNVQPFRARLENTGITLVEEDYLLGNYPKEPAAEGGASFDAISSVLIAFKNRLSLDSPNDDVVEESRGVQKEGSRNFLLT